MMKAKELSVFCLQTAFLLEAGLSLDNGFEVMAEDVEDNTLKDKLKNMALDLELGMPLEETLVRAELFPEYMIQMVGVGHRTGNLEEVMKALADYYDKEASISKAIKNAVSYPLMMIFMLMVILFVLLTKVMPIFENLYKQMGASLSPVTQQAVKIGTIFSGVSIVAVLVLAAVVGVSAVLSSKGSKNGKTSWAEKLVNLIQDKSSIADLIAKRRVLAVLAMTSKSGLKLIQGLEMAAKLVTKPKMKAMIEKCRDDIELGDDVYEAFSRTGLFTNADMQLLKVGIRSGKEDNVYARLAADSEERAEEAIENLISKFEPTIVIALAAIVGMILLSVMMPLAGIMASIGV